MLVYDNQIPEFYTDGILKKTYKCNFCPPFYQIAATLVTGCHFDTWTSLIRPWYLKHIECLTNDQNLYWWDTPHINEWWPFWKMAATVVMGQICDGPIAKNIPKNIPKMCAKSHACIIKSTILAHICWTKRKFSKGMPVKSNNLDLLKLQEKKSTGK